ncbi:unnamed protein product [Brassicogethes aeneus]|uniref:DNA-directed DNA polymerase n=1 Tax=Brassicogethes aeneus TaxID=1431903 RepID=A0A9P0ASR5_BRAAE|nr:unnamed protein product [Brassicogethes aeneus]
MNVDIDLKNAKKCHICNKYFIQGDVIVRDHNHQNGQFRGFAHRVCNLNYKNTFMVPVVFHNLTKYDSHFLIKDLANFSRISLLPINKEKYISFTIYDNETIIKLRFVDSFRFMASIFDKLSSYLTEYPILRKEFKNLSNDNLTLLQRKGVFPYDFVDSEEKLDFPCLPEKSVFYKKLNDCDISENDYAHAQHIWREFGCQNLGEYSDLYLKTDSLLLADVFEQFRNSSFKTYRLDPAHYYTLPEYTWDCMLKYTQCPLQILKDVDMILFIEKAIRGGVSQCCNRYSEANNKYMTNFNPSKPSKYLLYFNVNALYSWGMSQYLPYDGFEWVKNHENFDDFNVSDNSPVGYFLEVDLEYPQHLHDLHKDLPFCPENQKPPNSKLSKLMTTLTNKSKYIIHYRNLKQALSHGLILTKIHRFLKFKQSPWLKPYIELNTNLRQNAKNDFEKNLFKFQNNSAFVKTMENIRKHRIVKLVTRWEGRYGAKNLIASPNFQNRTIFNENLIAVELSKTNLCFNKPLYIGMAILDILKTCVYAFHYDFILSKFNHTKLLYMDTDSLVYEFNCNDAYDEIIRENIHRFDTSDYAKNNQCNIPLINKTIPGLMKDELNGKIMSHFVGLRSKMYTFKIEGEKCVKKSKGVKNTVVKNGITFQDYFDYLNTKTDKIISQNSIRSITHNVYSIKQQKIGLSSFDDRRYLLENITHDTLPWGHYSINHN